MSKQSEAKKLQNYNPKPEPSNCANCKHFNIDSVVTKGWDNKIHYQEKNLRCGIGGFAVKKRGICSSHEYNGRGD